MRCAMAGRTIRPRLREPGASGWRREEGCLFLIPEYWWRQQYFINKTNVSNPSGKVYWAYSLAAAVWGGQHHLAILPGGRRDQRSVNHRGRRVIQIKNLLLEQVGPSAAVDGVVLRGQGSVLYWGTGVRFLGWGGTAFWGEVECGASLRGVTFDWNRTGFGNGNTGWKYL